MTQETEFEKRRGVSRVESRTGFAKIQALSLKEPLSASRLELLGAVGAAGVAIDFLKMTPGGVSFLLPEASLAKAKAAIAPLGVDLQISESLRIVIVHAVNIRDEEGLIARILRFAIGRGADVQHVADMHDRVLMVVGGEDADWLAAALKEEFLEAAHAH